MSGAVEAGDLVSWRYDSSDAQGDLDGYAAVGGAGADGEGAYVQGWDGVEGGYVGQRGRGGENFFWRELVCLKLHSEGLDFFIC